MRRITIGYVMIGLIVVAASLSATEVTQAAWSRLAALGFEAVGDHACTDGIKFRLTDLHPRTYVANHVIITSTVSLATIVDTAFAPIPANPIKVDFDGQGTTYEDYTYSGYYTESWSTALISGNSVKLDFQDPQLSQREVLVVNCLVANLPAIRTQPAGRVVDAGQSATLNVDAIGLGTLSYQWYQGVSGDVTTPIGTGSAILTTPAQSVDTPYWVRVSSDLGSVDSNTVMVWVAVSHVYVPLLVK